MNWPFNGEYWKDELFSIQIFFKSICIENPKPKMPPNFISNEIYLNDSLQINDSTVLEQEIDNLDKAYKNLNDILSPNFKMMSQIGALWMGIEAGSFDELETKQRLMSLWEMRLRNAVLDSKRSNLDGNLDVHEVIRAYRLYLSTIKPSRFEMAMTRHLAQIEQDTKKSFLAGKHYEKVYEFNKDIKFLNLSVKNYEEEIKNPENDLNLKRSQKGIQRLKTYLLQNENISKTVNPSGGNK